ncbi:uncharacterized protein KY384_005838 [Bacidia gigantensis]|uniref:uncharacterized protein n=1 Tax=Bacidia gigantensis TaxID=2732470 RepID=UPI001D04C3B1|nr:uncharacterized protein KY384_005838 [Bacidia gigantensis]KAG8529203.1 hypothetical protein KY384_005838 [Bacidia gigantensis]
MTPSSTTQKTIQQILSCSRLTVSGLEELQGHLHRICSIRLSNGARLIFKTCPSPFQTLLRPEQTYLDSEATILQLLANTYIPVPRILKYEPALSSSTAPFILTTCLPGSLYADVIHHRTKTERGGIERQVQALRSSLNQYTSFTYGPAGLVKAGKGFRTWKEAFIAMIESLLMDGEDMLVNLPYFQIREAISRWETYLEDVREARLVIPGLGDPSNTLIDLDANEVTGLLDYGRAMWGDVAMAEVGRGKDIKGLLYVLCALVM